MSEEIQNYEERHGMSPGVALLMGIGIGIVGTVIVLAANEERFGRAVRATKKRARDVGKRFRHGVDEAKERAAEVADRVETGARRVGEKLRT